MESTIAKIESLMMYRGAGCEAGKLELILRERDEQLKQKIFDNIKELSLLGLDCYSYNLDECPLPYGKCNKENCPILKTEGVK
jgi:hypothetical protein